MTGKIPLSTSLATIACLLLLLSCKRPFDPVLKPGDNNSLVVEGFIDGAAPTRIHLSRVRNVTPGDLAPLKNELHASVSVDDDRQNSYPLGESGDGIYTSASTLPLDPARQYHVHISTSAGKEYASAFVSYKSAPVIDTINWKYKDDGVQLYLNAHDDANRSRFYRWDYTETWEFHVFHYSTLRYDAATNTVVPRTSQVYTCWRSDNATSVLLGNTTKLSSDVVSQAPIAFIENHNDKLSVLYSILVTQYVIDVNAYNFWFALKSNTEGTGSIFDPQPNETPGNIHALSNAAERVLGFISAGTTTQKRIFIDHSIVPADWDIPQDCHLIRVENTPGSLKFYFNAAGYAPISQAGGGAFSASYKDCVDCTLRGTNIKPSFWP